MPILPAAHHARAARIRAAVSRKEHYPVTPNIRSHYRMISTRMIRDTCDRGGPRSEDYLQSIHWCRNSRTSTFVPPSCLWWPRERVSKTDSSPTRSINHIFLSHASFQSTAKTPSWAAGILSEQLHSNTRDDRQEDDVEGTSGKAISRYLVMCQHSGRNDRRWPSRRNRGQLL